MYAWQERVTVGFEKQCECCGENIPWGTKSPAEYERRRFCGKSCAASHSAAMRNAQGRPGPCVAAGHTIGRPSQRAITNNRSRVVGAPWSHAGTTRHSTT